ERQNRRFYRGLISTKGYYEATLIANSERQEPKAANMPCFTMNYQLTIPAILRRAELHYADKEIVSELPDKTLFRYGYGEMARRAKRLAVALLDLGIQPGDRVATLCWNHHHHLEAYFGVTAAGAVLHTLNLRLHANDLAYIVEHAQDKILLVDEVLLPVLE